MEIVGELISKISGSQLITLSAIILGILAGIIIPVVAILSSHIRGHRDRQLAANLIRDMAERGFTVDEIERLVRLSVIEDAEDMEKLVANRQ